MNLGHHNSWNYAIGQPETQVVERAISEVALKGRGGKGIPILFAMSNKPMNACAKGIDRITSHPDVIAISSTTNQDVKHPDHAYGECLKLLGPTKFKMFDPGLITTDMLGKYGYNNGRLTDLEDLDYTYYFGGNSGATPIVSGAFGLALSIKPNLTHNQLLDLFTSTAKKVDASNAGYDKNGFSKTHGYGRIDVYEALKKL